jgi:hypothetical protein
MSGRCLPEQPDFLPAAKFRAEKTVWTALRRNLRDQDVLLHGVRFVGNDGDWEADLILLLPEGFAVVEVKGGHVWYADGAYHQRTPEGIKIIDLDEQALSEKYLLRRYLTHHPRWQFGTVRMAHFVALPDVVVGPDDDFGPGLPRDRLLDRNDVPQAGALIWGVLNRTLDRRIPGAAAVELAAELLGGRGNAQREVVGLLGVRNEHVERLSAEHAALLDHVALMSRYQVVGGPGSGKTFLAIEQAKRWANQGLRVAFVAYSRGLTTWVERQVSTWSAQLPNRIVVSTFHGLGHDWGAVVADSTRQQEWDQDIPRRMATLAAQLPEEQRFDALIVDEAQDFDELWWPALLAALRDPGLGRLAVFGDATQRVFPRAGADDLGLPPLLLSENIRNTSEIGNLINALRPAAAMRLLGGAGPAVRFVACREDSAITTADDAAVELLDAGWSPADVALLTTGHRHPMQREYVELHGRDEYWDLLWDGSDVFYATVAGFKGLERPAVVLAVNGFVDPGVARDTLLVGISRARDLLVVCADPDVIREVGGKELAKRLGL